MLHQAGIGRFRHLNEEPAVSEVRLALNPSATNQLTWEDGVGKGSGDDPFVVFELPRPLMVHAVRIKYAYANTQSPALFQIYWKDSEKGFAEERSKQRSLRTDVGARSVTITVGDFIDALRIDPDVKPCEIRIVEIVLLVPITRSQSP